MLTGISSMRTIGFGTATLRLLLSFLCGALIGFERSYKNRPAGFRTHILVCIGATTASMTGVYLYLNLGLPTDISRLGAQVVSGLGFIGAGTIIVTRNRTVKGLTPPRACGPPASSAWPWARAFTRAACSPRRWC